MDLLRDGKSLLIIRDGLIALLIRLKGLAHRGENLGRIGIKGFRLPCLVKSALSIARRKRGNARIAREMSGRRWLLR